MNYFFRKLFSKHIKPEEEGEFLVRVVSGSAFGVFSDEHFRQMIRFEKRPLVEQDRIFNELVVTGLMLPLMMINDFLPDVEPDRKQFWRDIREGIPDLFVGWLKEIGVENKFTAIWKKLIHLRWDEYKREQVVTRRIFSMGELANVRNEAFKDAAVRIETAAVGGLFHITRGKARPNDPLFKHLRAWLSVLDQRLEAHLQHFT